MLHGLERIGQRVGQHRFRLLQRIAFRGTGTDPAWAGAPDGRVQTCLCSLTERAAGWIVAANARSGRVSNLPRNFCGGELRDTFILPGCETGHRHGISSVREMVDRVDAEWPCA